MNKFKINLKDLSKGNKKKNKSLDFGEKLLELHELKSKTFKANW